MKMKIPGITQAHEKCAMKTKEKKPPPTHINFFWEESFDKAVFKNGWMDFNELWDIDSQ